MSKANKLWGDNGFKYKGVSVSCDATDKAYKLPSRGIRFEKLN